MHTIDDTTRRSVFACVLAAPLLGGCYYLQAISGHVDLMNRRQPVDEIIGDPQSPEELRTRLELVREARRFAVTDLELPDNESYLSYADLERDYVVWNVFAAPEFSLTPKTWCYPFVGCVAYRGYFKEEKARQEAGKLESRGYDVVVGGVSAYSTLGRFDDPVLNTMMRWNDADLVTTLFHELAHQKLFVKGDTEFNESFATAVAEFGIERWLAARGEDASLEARRSRVELRRRVMALIEDGRSELTALYAMELPDDEKRRRKAAVLEALSRRIEREIERSGTGVRNWLAGALNNARLVSQGVYEGRLEEFRALLIECQGDLACFYARAEALAESG